MSHNLHRPKLSIQKSRKHRNQHKKRQKLKTAVVHTVGQNTRNNNNSCNSNVSKPRNGVGRLWRAAETSKAVNAKRLDEILRPQLADADLARYKEADDHLRKIVRIVKDVKECQAIVARLKCQSPAVVAFDAEGENLSCTGRMTLIQLATYDGQVFLFDLIACKSLVIVGGLWDILESTTVLKVVHDCCCDAQALYYQFGVHLRNVFDSQVAHAVLHQQLTGMPAQSVSQISLNNLCVRYDGQINPGKDNMKKKYKCNNKFWGRRPLTDEMILYAAYDVWVLVPTVYDAIVGRLKEGANNALLKELCARRVEGIVSRLRSSYETSAWIESQISSLKRLTGGGGTAVMLKRMGELLSEHAGDMKSRK